MATKKETRNAFVQVRITKRHHGKLRRIADANERSNSKQASLLLESKLDSESEPPK